MPDEKDKSDEENETIRIGLDGADMLEEEQQDAFRGVIISLDAARRRIAYLEGRLDSTMSIFWMVVCSAALFLILRRMYD